MNTTNENGDDCLLDYSGTQVIEIENTTIEYRHEGEGVPLVLIPGTVGDQNVFCRVIPRLSEEFSVYALNIPDMDDIEELTRVLSLFIDQKISDPVILLGTSLGGWIAQFLVSRYPKKIEKLILSSTFGSTKELRENNLTTFKISRYLPWQLVKWIFKSKVSSFRPDYYSGHFHQYAEANIEAMGKHQLRNRLSMSLIEQHPKKLVALPTVLIIYAHDDPVIPPGATASIKEMYSEARVEELETGGHFPYVFRPKTYLNILLDFIRNPKNI